MSSQNIAAIPGAGVAPVEQAGFVPASELVMLCAVDSELYNRTFFPNAFRQPSPPFHREIDDILERRGHRHVAVEVFRGGAKTTKLRAYTSKRIAYGTSRTILFVSESQGHSAKSLAWIRKQVEFNRRWAMTFGLQRGGKWTDEIIEIKHTKFGWPITIIALGITGQIRGLNVDDYRPDLIVIDDPCNEENTATPEQREKTEKLVFGALDKSLAPATECPDAKMVLLQTSLHQEDLINKCHVDPSWQTKRFSIFDEDGLSRWPDRFPTDAIYEDKKAHSDRGQLLLWLREMECSVASEETAHFKREWLQYYDDLPEGLPCFLAIDPVPPPTERKASEGRLSRDTDYEVLSVVGVSGGNFYLLDLSASRGHTPEWTVNEFFRLVDKWHPLKARVEGVAYQRTLKWILEKEMGERRRFIQVDAEGEKRKKLHRIIQAFSGIGSQKRFFLPRERTATLLDFEAQFVSYPQVKHDDLLDGTAMAIDAASEYPVDIDLLVEGGPQDAVHGLAGFRVCP